MLFQCEFCEGEPQQFEITDESLEWEVVDSDERENGMGPRVSYQAQWETTCPKCGANLSAIFGASEYPVGVMIDDEPVYNGIMPVHHNEKIYHKPSFR